MDFSSLVAELRRSFRVKPHNEALIPPKRDEPASTLHLDRPLSHQEHAIAKWLLLNTNPPATSFLPQLDGARVTGQCSCGCPTVDMQVANGALRAEIRDNPIGDATGEVEGHMVGVMLLQSEGYLRCLEIYDLSEIEHPYGLPDLASLRPFDAVAKPIA